MRVYPSTLALRSIQQTRGPSLADGGWCLLGLFSTGRSLDGSSVICVFLVVDLLRILIAFRTVSKREP